MRETFKEGMKMLDVWQAEDKDQMLDEHTARIDKYLGKRKRQDLDDGADDSSDEGLREELADDFDAEASYFQSRRDWAQKRYKEAKKDLDGETATNSLDWQCSRYQFGDRLECSKMRVA